MRTKQIILAFILLFPLIAFSQPYVDILNVKSQFFQKTNYTDSSQNKLMSNQQEANFFLPIELKNKNKDVILIGGDYTQLNFTASGKSNGYGHLQTTSLQLGFEKGWNEKWRTMLLFIPKFNAAYTDIFRSDFQYGGVILFKYQKKENLSYHFGAYYNREFFGNYYLPLLGIDWRINNRLNLFGDLPYSMNLEYKLSKSFYGGFEFFSTTSSYRTTPHGGTSTYIREGDKIFGHDEIRLYFHAYLTSHIVLTVQGGQSFYHIFQAYSNAGNKVINDNSVYQKNKDQLFFNVGLAYRFRLDGENK
jgi:hypothetical protein